MSKPPVLVTIGGTNSRFFPFNSSRHKSAVTLMGKPIIYRMFEQLAEHNYHDVIVVLHPRDNEAGSWKEPAVKDFPQLHFTFIVQDEALGAGDAVLRAKEFLGKQFIVTAYHNDTAAIADKLLALGSEAAVAVSKTDRPWEYGIVSCEGDRATEIIEKPEKGQEKSDLRISTTNLLNDKFLDILSKLPAEEYNYETAINELMRTETVKFLEIEKSLSLKYPWHLFDWQKWYFSQLKSHQEASAKIAKSAEIDETDGPVYIGTNVVIGHTAHIIGPAYIGDNTIIGDFTLVRQSSIEKDCVIGALTEVARSIVMADTHLHFGYLADSILGEHINIGGGVVTANKRLDDKNVSVVVKGEKVSTDRRKLGVLIGDSANLGIRVSTMPGVAIGHHAQIFPSQTLYQNVEAESTVK